VVPASGGGGGGLRGAALRFGLLLPSAVGLRSFVENGGTAAYELLCSSKVVKLERTDVLNLRQQSAFCYSMCQVRSSRCILRATDMREPTSQG
jgi:hypothetical protein